MNDKSICLYRWHDASNLTGLMTRSRVAYLLRAARSRRDGITKLSSGYAINTLQLIITR